MPPVVWCWGDFPSSDSSKIRVFRGPRLCQGFSFFLSLFWCIESEVRLPNSFVQVPHFCLNGGQTS